MAKKRTTDPGLRYLMEIGFDRIRGKNALLDRWKKVFGPARAEKLWETWRGLSASTQAFYDFKNSDPEISRSFSEAFDGDILRKACNYIDAHRYCFGSSILEVGCDCGYMTGFLAKTFPDARIISVDRCASAIETAKKRLEGMGLHNVEFRAASPEDLTERFDTVFCMRILHENLEDALVPFPGEPLDGQIARFGEITEAYTELLLSRLNENGALCVFERDTGDPLLCGWMTKLCLSGCAPDLQTYGQILCEEAGEAQPFQAFVCRRGTVGDTAAIRELWLGAHREELKEQTLITGWGAAAYLASHEADLIRGARIFDRGGRQVGRFALYRDRENASLLCLLSAEEGAPVRLFGLSRERQDEALEYLRQKLEKSERSGLRIEKLAPDDASAEDKA